MIERLQNRPECLSHLDEEAIFFEITSGPRHCAYVGIEISRGTQVG